MSAHTPGRLTVEPTDHNQYAINNRQDRPIQGQWDDIYINFSGYFGGYGPNVFAAAPELFEALKDAYPYIDNDHLRKRIGAVITKAGGAT